MLLEIGGEKPANMKEGSGIRWDRRRGYLKRNPGTGELISQRTQEYFFDLGKELNETKTIEATKCIDVALDKVSGFDEIYKELKKMETPGDACMDFNFQMGIACREMGFIDEAIDEFKQSIEKGQKPSESANHLSRCYRDKGWLQEATEAFQKALGIKDETEEGSSPKIIAEMDLVEAL